MSLPYGWQQKKVRDLCNLVNGDAYKPSDWSDSGIRIIRIQNLNDHSKPFNFWAGKLDDRVLVKDGDVLIAWSGTPGTSFGAHIWNRGQAVLNQHIFRVDLKSNMVTRDWFKLAINQSLHILIQRAHGGVGLRHVTRREVDELVIPLPSLPEQERIVCLLDEAEQLRKLRNQASTRMEEFVPALFHEMFGDPITNPKNIKVITMKDACLKITDGTHVTPTYTDQGVPFLRVTDIQADEIDWHNVKHIPHEEYVELIRRVKPEKGDILYSKNGTIGIAKEITWDTPFTHFVSLALLKPNHSIFDSTFLTAFLNTPFALHQAKGHSKTGTVTNLHLVEINKIRVPCPPIAIQREFAQRVQEAREIGARQAQAAQRVEALYQSMLSRAFAGEL